MNNAVINIKTSPETKELASQVAEDLGFSLSSLINAYLRDLVRTKRVSFTLGEQPTPYFKEELQKSQGDVRKGKVSPRFTNSREATAWLKDSNA